MQCRILLELAALGPTAARWAQGRLSRAGPLVVRDVEIAAGDTVHVSCAVSGRMSLADQIACPPVASR